MIESDSIRLACTHCGKRLRVAAKAAGKQVCCPGCAEPVQIPAEADSDGQMEAISRPLWPWFAGGGIVLVVLVGLGAWLLSGPKNSEEPGTTAVKAEEKIPPARPKPGPGPIVPEKKAPTDPAGKPAPEPPKPVDPKANDPLPGAKGPKLVKLVESPFDGHLSIRARGSISEEWLPAYPPDTAELFVHVVTDTKSNGFVLKPRKIEVRLRAPRGTTDVGIGEPKTIETPSVGTVVIDEVYPCRAAQGSLPEGPYQAEVWIDGIRTLQLNWAVQTGAPRPGKTVRLDEYLISDQRLKGLAKDPDLTVLTLSNGGSGRGTVSAEGLRALAASERLHTLSLWSLRLDESCFEALAALPRLRKLSINGPAALTDKALAELAKIKTLEELRLGCRAATFTPAGLKELTALPKLESLEIGELGARVSVDDAGLKELAKIKTLKSLSLPYCPKITDDGLQELAVLKDLRFLGLVSVQGESRVTRSGVERLQKALPGLRVYRGREDGE